MQNRRPETTRHVVWDGDNTLWDWMSYAVPAYEAMCGEISRIALKTQEQTAQAMKSFYSSAGTLEDEGLVQGLYAADFFEGVADFDMQAVISQVHAAFSRVRSENLHLYDGILSVMTEIRGRGLEQIMITDAPLRQASARVAHCGVKDMFSRIYGMPSADHLDLPLHLKGPNLNGFPDRFVLQNEKPNTDLENIFGMTREEIAKYVVIIGDNPSKDMQLARLYGCLGIHAKYGASDPGLGERIQRFAPLRVAGRNMQGDFVCHGGGGRTAGGGGESRIVSVSGASGVRIVPAHYPSDISNILFAV